MIKKILHKNIDFKQYEHCIKNAHNHRIYAEHWYLNLVTNNSWDCLVLDDYKAVMPLPYKKKLGIKYIVMPNFCQQLGVFYQNELSDEEFLLFQKKLHHCLVRSYQFNEENTFQYSPKGELRNNYLLNCAEDYSVLKQAYQKDRKNDLKKIELSTCEIQKEIDFLSVEQLIQSSYEGIITKQEVGLIEKLLQLAEKHAEIIQLKIVCSDNCVASNIFLKSHKRVINLGTFRDKSFKMFNASAVMLDAIIQQNNDGILDFEGSMIEGVASFFESFGAKKHFYTVYHNC